MKKAKAFLAVGRFAQRLKATVFQTVQKSWKKASVFTSSLPSYAIASDYEAWRDRFLWQRLHLALWVAIVLVLTFAFRDVYDALFHLKELANIPKEAKRLFFVLYAAMVLSLLSCLAIHKTQFGRRYPGFVFLGLGWSITIVEQIWATLNNFALPDIFAWFVMFLSQATLIPVRFPLHLVSQLGVLIYYFGVNTALGLKQPPPDSNKPIYSVTMSLALFWFCFICNFGVYLYDRLQRSEFSAHKELETAYQKLGATEEKYRSIFENAVEGIFQSTPDGRYITANPALARIYGYSFPEEVIANLTDIENQLYVAPNRRTEFMRLIEEHGSVSEFESQIYRKDGSIVWISEKAYAVRDQNGKLLYYEGVISDITKRKQVEEALQEQLNFLQVLVNTIPTPVFYQNAQGLYVGCNKAFEEDFGLSQKKILGKTVYEIAPEELAQKYYQADKELLEQGGVQTSEGSVIYKDNTKHDVIFYKATFSKADGTLGGLVGVILDISQRKRTEEALRVFFHAVSHDLRNPVLGTLMVLKNLLSHPEEKILLPRSILERMVQSSDRQLNLINSLMEAHVSEVQGIVLQPQTLQLHTVVEAAIADLEPMLKENQAFLTNLVSDVLPSVNADSTQLWRVYSNLIVNAVKHNPPGLSITLDAIALGDKVCCTVADNGVGMSQQQSQHLFDLYFRGNNVRNSLSLGLGLYLCRQIITAHGGEIGVKSDLGKGATFWFTLPLEDSVKSA
ncbi:MAG: PAS domain S-box protein [Brasilonema octagenarum HA4186-MV1]|uniref:histidine kinase n=1 Tax=Brasilonema sennae CENA114 TaxID=415709 RepID=A0A856MNN4_9CYAN|nr:PAS domain-containing sensor histidine kinase [Brasilonema sennae]MBW4625360.1 PAS domain S-box protein [Brasilonema octagenarum HA4186-MV1]QDL12298.1 PAS domain-containing sensor histidine kinase [Brasilonema sennae CENA114]QDL18677.1 PAS domain-containing sensor histidine kinase [Brasilonema octagenarum UFV-E1]